MQERVGESDLLVKNIQHLRFSVVVYQRENIFCDDLAISEDLQIANAPFVFCKIGFADSFNRVIF
jgi:hypothetical protein